MRCAIGPRTVQVLLSFLLLVMGYFAMRASVAPCLVTPSLAVLRGVPLLDVLALPTMLIFPSLSGHLLVLFIHAYVLSAAIKVRSAALQYDGERPQLRSAGAAAEKEPTLLEGAEEGQLRAWRGAGEADTVEAGKADTVEQAERARAQKDLALLHERHAALVREPMAAEMKQRVQKAVSEFEAFVERHADGFGRLPPDARRARRQQYDGEVHSVRQALEKVGAELAMAKPPRTPDSRPPPPRKPAPAPARPAAAPSSPQDAARQRPRGVLSSRGCTPNRAAAAGAKALGSQSARGPRGSPGGPRGGAAGAAAAPEPPFGRAASAPAKYASPPLSRKSRGPPSSPFASPPPTPPSPSALPPPAVLPPPKAPGGAPPRKGGARTPSSSRTMPAPASANPAPSAPPALKAVAKATPAAGRTGAETRPLRHQRQATCEFDAALHAASLRPQWPLAQMHVWIAYAGLMAVGALLGLSTALVWGLCYLPLSALVYGVVWLACAAVPLLEDVWCASPERGAEPPIRVVTGWFRDICNTLRLDVRQTLNMPRVFLSPAYRLEHFGQLDVGGRDAGFLTLVFGFNVFWLSMVAAPLCCYGVWIGLPVVLGALPLSDALAIMMFDVHAGWALASGLLQALMRLDVQMSWPPFLSLDAVLTFLGDPHGEIVSAWQYLTSLQTPTDFDAAHYLRGAEALLRLNSVLALLKPISTGLLQAWLLVSNATWSRNAELSAERVRLISFGACIPGKAQIDSLVRERAVQRFVATPLLLCHHPDRLQMLLDDDLRAVDASLQMRAGLREKAHGRLRKVTVLHGKVSLEARPPHALSVAAEYAEAFLHATDELRARLDAKLQGTPAGARLQVAKTTLGNALASLRELEGSSVHVDTAAELPIMRAYWSAMEILEVASCNVLSAVQKDQLLDVAQNRHVQALLKHEAVESELLRAEVPYDPFVMA